MQSEVIFRQMQPGDGQALAVLFERSPDSGRFKIAARYHIDPYLAIQAVDPGVVGVVAERPSTSELVGMGLVQTGRCCVGGVERPYALLTSLMVHPAYRQQGIASQLAQWRIDYARRELGDDVMLLAFIQEGNEASLAVAQKWGQQTGGQLQSGLVKIRHKLPQSAAGLTVRAALREDFGQIVDHMNNFYREYELYTSETAVSLADWLEESPFDTPIRQYFVVTNDTGKLLAGMAVTEQCKATTMYVEQMPVIIRLLNKVVRMVPPDGVLRQMGVSKIWYSSKQLEAAQFLWESLHWQYRHQGSHFVCSYDPNSTIPEVLHLPFWLPKSHLMIIP